jgi:hypothetical protein
MTKDKAYEAWLESDPKARVAYSAFNAGWEARKWKGLTEEEATNIAILFPDNRSLAGLMAVNDLLMRKNG